MKANQKGFSVVELLIIIAVVGLLGAAGWLIFNRQNRGSETKVQQEAPTAGSPDNTASTAPHTVTRIPNSTRQTVTYKDASFSFDLPQDWTYSGAASTLDYDEYNGYVVSPDKKLQLSIYIQKISLYKDYSVSSGPYQNSFSGIGGKTFYLEEVSTNGNNVNQLSVSACGPNACKTLEDHTTKLNDTYWLNIAIDPGSSAVAPHKLSINDPLVTQIKAVIGSVTIE